MKSLYVKIIGLGMLLVGMPMAVQNAHKYSDAAKRMKQIVQDASKGPFMSSKRMAGALAAYLAYGIYKEGKKALNRGEGLLDIRLDDLEYVLTAPVTDAWKLLSSLASRAWRVVTRQPTMEYNEIPNEKKIAAYREQLEIENDIYINDMLDFLKVSKPEFEAFKKEYEPIVLKRIEDQLNELRKKEAKIPAPLLNVIKETLNLLKKQYGYTDDIAIIGLDGHLPAFAAFGGGGRLPCLLVGLDTVRKEQQKDILDNDSLMGNLAHEFQHIRNEDTLTRYFFHYLAHAKKADASQEWNKKINRYRNFMERRADIQGAMVGLKYGLGNLKYFKDHMSAYARAGLTTGGYELNTGTHSGLKYRVEYLQNMIDACYGKSPTIFEGITQARDTLKK